MEPQQYPLSSNEAPQNVNNPLAVMQPGERVICELRRHPFGLISVYAIAALVVAIAISVAIFIPYYGSFLTSDQRLGVVLTCALAIVVTLIVAYVSVYIYQGNRWVVTSDSVTQIARTGLFNTRTSQLSLANLEDVSVQQDGLIQQLLGFGDLRVETAGERSHFTFTFCPNPNEYARKIIAAHEEYIAARPQEMVVTNRPLATTTSFNQPPQQMQQ